MSIAHPAINQLQLADAVIVFGRRVIPRVDVLEFVTSTLEPVEH
jgi:hypothetical protein